MFSTRKLSEIFALLVLLTIAAPTRAQDAAAHRGRGRIVVLMVWDGLRPDLVTQRDTPNLFRMAREGVRFDRHHSIFPTLTMVNATALATGAPPGVNGLVGNNFYLEPSPETPKGQLVSAEGPKAILNLNGATAFKGRLIGLDTIAQEVEREGGYVAVIGKQGPTSVFDNRVTTIANGKDVVGEPHQDYLFASEDFVATSSSDKITVPPESKTAVVDEQRDLYFARLAVEDALPEAKRAADAGRPALVVFWQHNPDLTQHIAGLGTAPAMEALSLCDNNLMRVRDAIDALGIADRTDVIVVSDHGFATIKFRIVLSEMLVAAGLKKSKDSTDVVVVPNGGADLIYLSPTEFATPESKQRGAAEDRQLRRSPGMVRADLLSRSCRSSRRKRTEASRPPPAARPNRISDGSTAPSASESSASTTPPARPTWSFHFARSPTPTTRRSPGRAIPHF